MFLPEGIDSFRVRGRTYLATANEADVREWPGLTGAVRLGNAAYPLDPTVFPNAAALKANAALGRLNVSLVDGKSPAGTAYRTIYAYGGRSFSIWSADDGRLVWDSGDDFERVTAQALPSNFNSNNDEDNFDTRSDDRNPGQALSQLTRSILPVQDTFTWYRRARTRKSETHP